MQESIFEKKVHSKLPYSVEINAESVVPIRDGVLVSDMEFKNTLTKSGIILLDDNGKDDGIHPRWAKVYAVGPQQRDVKVGQWVLVAHGRWTRGVKLTHPVTNEETIIRRVDCKDMLGISDEKPENA
jgi:co-chaperonin GroES (HSP10)